MPRPSRETLVRHAQELNQDDLLGYPNVIGVATGFREREGKTTDEVVVQVFVDRPRALHEVLADRGGSRGLAFTVPIEHLTGIDTRQLVKFEEYMRRENT